MLPLQPGDPSRIAGFDLLGRIGAGGMGVVYLGRRAIDGAEAAIKLIRDDLSADPRIRARFAREAAAVTRVHSRHVAPAMAWWPPSPPRRRRAWAAGQEVWRASGAQPDRTVRSYTSASNVGTIPTEVYNR